jgi:hypothetical protein
MKSLIRLSHYIPALLLVVVIAIACSKNSNNNNTTTKPDSTTATNPSLITSKPWTYDTSGLDTNNDGIIDIGGDTTVVHLCERDDIYTFKLDSTGTVNTGTNHCIAGEPQTEPFAWSLSTDQKTLRASFNPILQEGVTILKLDSVQWSVYRDSTVAGVTYRYIVILKH